MQMEPKADICHQYTNAQEIHRKTEGFCFNYYYLSYKIVSIQSNATAEQ